MQSRKMWQALPIVAVFLLLSALGAYCTAKFFPNEKWGVFVAIGAGLMIAALLPLIFWNKHPVSAFVTLFLNTLACGIMIGDYFIGTHTPLTASVALLSALASAGAYLALAVLINIPVLKTFHAYRLILVILWLAALFTVGGVLWGKHGGENYAAFTLLSIETAFFAAGSLLGSTDGKEELFAALALPSSLAAGIIALVLLCVLGGDGDCDCDCLDGASVADCCDCSPDYAPKKNKAPSSLSEMSDPLNENSLFPPNKL